MTYLQKMVNYINVHRQHFPTHSKQSFWHDYTMLSTHMGATWTNCGLNRQQSLSLTFNENIDECTGHTSLVLGLAGVFSFIVKNNVLDGQDASSILMVLGDEALARS